MRFNQSVKSLIKTLLKVHEADPDVSQVVPEAIATLVLVSKPLGVSPSLVNKYPSFAKETFLLL